MGDRSRDHLTKTMKAYRPNTPIGNGLTNTQWFKDLTKRHPYEHVREEQLRRKSRITLFRLLHNRGVKVVGDERSETLVAMIMKWEKDHHLYTPSPKDPIHFDDRLS